MVTRYMTTVGRITFLILAFFLVLHSAGLAKDIMGEGFLGPQSALGIGEKRILMVAVRFPDIAPTTPIETLKRRVVSGFNRYVVEQSYGLTSVNADFRGYVTLPDPLARYKVSQYNPQVDNRRVRKLIEDTMTAIEKEVDFSLYDHMLIIPAVHTTAGTGYGMICYCANPGMLAGVTMRQKRSEVTGAPMRQGRRGGREFDRNETLRSKGGKEFSGGVFVGAENAHLGMFAHDYFHALGGIYDGKRLVPCLYDYQRQADTSVPPSFENHAIYMGPWDIMSQHFVNKGEPPPGLSSFTKIRLGWIGNHQAQLVKPGETSFALLSPLSKGGQLLVVKVPLDDGTYYLIENRQPIGFDKMLPDAGILVLEVHPQAREGFGTVQVKSAVNSSKFAEATYKLEANDRNVFIDSRNNVAIIPLWRQNENLGVLVTTPNQSVAAIRAGRAIQALIDQNPGISDNEKETVILEAIAAFKANDFEKSYAIATKMIRRTIESR